MQFSIEELHEIADGLDGLWRDCRVALRDHEDEAHTASYKNVQQRMEYVKNLEDRVRTYLNEQTGSSFGPDVLPWKTHTKDDPAPKEEQVAGG